MPRINLDLEFLTHPKTVSISPLAQLLFIRSILYAARHLTDGFVPAGAITSLTCDMLNYDITTATVGEYASCGRNLEANDLVTELESVGWWVKITGGYDIHDFLEYQLSRKQVRQLSVKHQQSGRKGGLAKALANGKPTPSKTVANVYPLTNPNTNTNKEEKSTPLRATVVIDSEWITELGKNPAYQHINLTVEIGKMDAWLALPKNAKRIKTRSFVLNWLNKVEAPMQGGNGKVKPPPYPPKNDPIARGQWGKVYGKPEDYGYV